MPSDAYMGYPVFSLSFHAGNLNNLESPLETSNDHLLLNSETVLAKFEGRHNVSPHCPESVLAVSEFGAKPEIDVGGNVIAKHVPKEGLNRAVEFLAPPQGPRCYHQVCYTRLERFEQFGDVFGVVGAISIKQYGVFPFAS